MMISHQLHTIFQTIQKVYIYMDIYLDLQIKRKHYVDKKCGRISTHPKIHMPLVTCQAYACSFFHGLVVESLWNILFVLQTIKPKLIPWNSWAWTMNQSLRWQITFVCCGCCHGDVFVFDWKLFFLLLQLCYLFHKKKEKKKRKKRWDVQLFLEYFSILISHGWWEVFFFLEFGHDFPSFGQISKLLAFVCQEEKEMGLDGLGCFWAKCNILLIKTWVFKKC